MATDLVSRQLQVARMTFKPVEAFGLVDCRLTLAGCDVLQKSATSVLQLGSTIPSPASTRPEEVP